MKNNNGALAEDYVAKKLVDMGFEIAFRNYHCKHGEIDIIAVDNKMILFVEVKARRRNAIMSPCAAVDISKQRKIIKTAKIFLLENDATLQPRFDVYEVITYSSERFEVFSEQYIKGAFEVNERNGNY